MSDQLEGANYRCPACTGEFPNPVDGGCPWCGQQLQEFPPLEELTPPPRGQMVTKVVRKDEKRPKGVLAKINELFQ